MVPPASIQTTERSQLHAKLFARALPSHQAAPPDPGPSDPAWRATRSWTPPPPESRDPGVKDAAPGTAAQTAPASMARASREPAGNPRNHDGAEPRRPGPPPPSRCAPRGPSSLTLRAPCCRDTPRLAPALPAASARAAGLPEMPPVAAHSSPTPRGAPRPPTRRPQAATDRRHEDGGPT